MLWSHVWKKMFSKKVFDPSTFEDNCFKRCLTLFDLTFIGIGSTIGAGLYIIIGQIIHNKAGPSTFLSFILGGIASLFSALCYAELTGRYPFSGSAFLFTYISVNHVTSFVIGWTIILEYCIASASIARAIMGYFDSLCSHSLSNFFHFYMPINVPLLAKYPDFLALALILIISILLCLGIRESVRVNTIFTFVNMGVVLFVTTCGLFYINFNFWNIPADKIPPGNGKGGFFPYGFSSTMAGAATSFFAYSGFDVIATTSQEAEDPKRTVPRSIMLCTVIVIIIYSTFSAILTLIMPYYEINPELPVRDIFEYIGYPQVKILIDIGTLSAMMASLLGAMVAAPRFLYSLAEEYMVFYFISKISPKFNTPYIATLICAFLSGFVVLIFDLKSLVDMLSIGTLLEYGIVSLCVLFLRYDPEQELFFNEIETTLTPETKKRSIILISVNMLFSVGLCFLVKFRISKLFTLTWLYWVLALIMIMGIIATTVLLYLLPHFGKSNYFLAPFSPMLPILNFIINFYLMISLNIQTWVRFFAWLGIGSFIYFGYALRMRKIE